MTNINVDVYEDREDAVQAAIDGSDIGARIIICRGDWSKCTVGGVCPMCARIRVTEGLTAQEALAMARAAHA